MTNELKLKHSRNQVENWIGMREKGVFLNINSLEDDLLTHYKIEDALNEQITAQDALIEKLGEIGAKMADKLQGLSDLTSISILLAEYRNTTMKEGQKK